MEIKAECERKAGGWYVRVPELDNLLISTKRLDMATEQIKDLVHEYQGVDRCDVVVKVEAAMPGIMCDLEAAQIKMRESQRLQEEASREIRDVVARLRNEGLSMRDIGVLLQISPQRVAQLTDSL
jgi:DNA-binding transcriptional MerR regulator